MDQQVFTFERWADWLRSKAVELNGKNVACTYRDTLGIPECASNPAFSIEVATPQILGRLSFWKGGTCDFEVMDISTCKLIANEAGLDANDETVEGLVARYLSYFQPTGTSAPHPTPTIQASAFRSHADQVVEAPLGTKPNADAARSAIRSNGAQE